MANEITQSGQLIQYGGPTLTLAGSKVGQDARSILARVGTGTSRGWKLFDSTQAAFLNTLTTISDGDFVLVNAKQLPMDFPVKVGGVAQPDYDVYPDIPEGTGTSPYVIQEFLTFFGVQFGEPVLQNAATKAVEPGKVSFQLDGGNELTYAQFNAALSAIPESECADGSHTYLLSVSVTSNAAATLSIPLL